MIYLFSDAGLTALHRFVSSDTLFAFDLDGTLAPIVADPGDILIPKPIRSRLARLSRLAATAVITGRARSDAKEHLGFEPRYLVGNHGVEGLPGYPGQEQELRTMVEQWEGQLQTLLSPEIKASILLERKGFSLSLHYRHVPDPLAVHAALLAAIDRLDPPPRRVGGKFVENLIPRGAPHKGDALLRLMELAGSSRAFFLGDDETDEDVFRLAEPRIFPVCVGTERPTAAEYHLKDQGETVRLLEEVLAILEALP